MEAFEDIINAEFQGIPAYKPEVAIVSAPTILFTLEAGVGNKTLPMLSLRLDFQSTVHDWSTPTVFFHLSIK